MPQPGYRECPVCAEEIRENAKVCRFCGAVLTEEKLPPRLSPAERRLVDFDDDDVSGRFEELGVAVTRQHRERLEQFLLKTHEQYRTASVMFVDISGYTRICSRLKAEMTKDILDVYYNVCTQTVNCYNGFVLEFQGDGCLAVFGAPVAFDRDAESAVRAAVGIVDRIRELPPVHGVKISVSAAVETGEVLSSVIRTRTPPQYKVFGSAVNLAARIKEGASPGQILIGPAAHRLVAPVVECTKLPPRRFKNVEKPVVTYRVDRLRLADLMRRDFDIPFVGRRQELGRMRDAWVAFVAKRREHAAGGIALSGEPGIGKTRVAREFVSGLARAARVAAIESAPHEGRIPWGLWRSLLAVLSGESVEGLALGACTRLRSFLQEAGLPPEERRLLLALAGDTVAAKAVASMPHASLRLQFRMALRMLLGSLAAERPLVLMFDDLHWADPTSMETLDELFAEPVGGVFFVLALRPGAPLPKNVSQGVTQIVLHGLDSRSGNALFDSVAAPDSRASGLRDELVSRAGGNPYFLVELVRSIDDAPAEYGRDVPAREEIIPLTLKEVLQSRIDSLDQRRRIVLQCGAVLGRRFQFEVIELFRFIREGLLGSLYSLKTIEFLDDAPSTNGIEFSFRHHVTREVAYQSLLERQRRELHELIAQAIEQKFAGQTGAHAAVLAFHFGMAEMHEQSARYYIMAADRALPLAATTEAYEFLGEAVRRLGMCPPSRQVDEQTADAGIKQAWILRVQGDAAGALAQLGKCTDLVSGLDVPLLSVRFAFESAAALLQLGRHAEALEHLVPAGRIAAGLGHDELHASVVNGVGWIAWERGDLPAAREAFETAGALCRQAGARRVAAEVRNNLALVAWKQGEAAAARTAFVEALGMLRSIGDRSGLARALVNYAIMLEQEGRYGEAKRRYEEALKLAEKLHLGQVVAAIHANLASLHLATDAYVDAEWHAALAVRMARRRGDRRSLSIALENLALANSGLGLRELARRNLRDAAGIARELNDRERIVSVELTDLELAFARGTPRAVLARTNAIAGQVSEWGFESERPRLLRLMALGSMHARKPDEARRHAESAAALARQQQNHAEERRGREIFVKLGNR